MLWIQLRRLRAADGAARARAAHALAERGNAKAIEPLGAALADQSWPDRWAAAAALGKLANGRAIPHLQNALSQDAEVDVRCNAAWALGRIGGKTVVEPLAAALDDDDESARRAAAEALAEVRGAAAAEALAGALDDAHHDVRLAAVKGLSSIGNGRFAPRFLAALNDAEWSVRAAAAALGRIGDPQAIDALRAVLESEGDLRNCDLRLRRNVAVALGDIGKAQGVVHLLKLSQDQYSAGVAVESLAKVVRLDAAQIPNDQLEALATLDDAEQIPWIIDEAEEAASGIANAGRRRAWRVDAADLRVLALAEVRRRD